MSNTMAEKGFAAALADRVIRAGQRSKAWQTGVREALENDADLKEWLDNVLAVATPPAPPAREFTNFDELLHAEGRCLVEEMLVQAITLLSITEQREGMTAGAIFDELQEMARATFACECDEQFCDDADRVDEELSKEQLSTSGRVSCLQPNDGAIGSADSLEARANACDPAASEAMQARQGSNSRP
jgi:hypothetical protein